MKHPDDVLLNAWADNALPEAERAAVEQHLEQCTECRQTAYALRTICDNVKSLSPVQVSRRLERDIIKMYRQERKKTDAVVQNAGSLFRKWFPAYSSIVAGIIAGLILGHLINPLITTLSSDSQVLVTENGQNENASEDLYLTRLIADNRSDLW